MAFEIVKKFVVKAEPQAVWAFLIDPERVASCLPGAAITGKLDDKTWQGTMSIKVGPVSSSYKGKIVFERLDEASMTADLAAIGQDVKGRGGADMKMKSVVRKNEAGETEVTASSQVNITGILAQMGRGMIQDVSDQMFQLFSQRMRAQLEMSAPAAPAGAATAPSPTSAASASSTAARTGPIGAAAPPAASNAAPSSVAFAPAAAAAAAMAAPPAASGPTARPLPPKPEVLDVGAIGTRAAQNLAMRTARSPKFWLAVAAAATAVYWIFG
jgi:carbon monoxide dehydrogenase subunit G